MQEQAFWAGLHFTLTLLCLPTANTQLAYRNVDTVWHPGTSSATVPNACFLILAWRHNSSRRSHSVQRQDRRRRVKISECPQHVRHTHSQPARVLSAYCCTLFRDCPCNDPSKHIADHNPSDPTLWLLQNCEVSHSQNL